MSIPEETLTTFRKAFPDAQVITEANINYILLPNMPAILAGIKKSVDLLLCPMQFGGYTTRLFLPEAIPSRGQNWSAHCIQGRPWHTFSFNNVPSTLSLHQILLAHLKVLA